jgi:hypothetical protein
MQTVSDLVDGRPLDSQLPFLSLPTSPPPGLCSMLAEIVRRTQAFSILVKRPAVRLVNADLAYRTALMHYGTRNTRNGSSGRRPLTKLLVATCITGAAGFLSVKFIENAVNEDRNDVQYTGRQRRKPEPITSLIRAYFVFSMCSIPMLVDYSPSILFTLTSIPGVKQVTEVFVRHTFFNQVSRFPSPSPADYQDC